MENLNPGLLDSKALYNNASQMARLQMGRFCMICLDYDRTYLEYLGNWSPLISIHTLLSHSLSLPSPPPKPLRQFSFEGTHFLKLSQSILWIYEKIPQSLVHQHAVISLALLLFALTESSLPPIQVLDVYEIPQPRAPQIPAKEHMWRSLRIPLT